MVRVTPTPAIVSVAFASLQSPPVDRPRGYRDLRLEMAGKRARRAAFANQRERLVKAGALVCEDRAHDERSLVR